MVLSYIMKKKGTQTNHFFKSYLFRNIVLFVGIRAKHAITRDEIVRNEMLENACETSKSADNALKKYKVSGFIPVYHRNLHSTITISRLKRYEEVITRTEGTK